MKLAETLFDAESGVATVTINRPEVLNAIDVPTAQALRDAVLPLHRNGNVRCVVLRGKGRAFVAGGDLSKFAEDFDKAGDVVDQLLDALHEVIKTLRGIDAPVIASVHGAAAGAGLSLMAACDLVIAAEGTRFLVAYDRIGASPDCSGTYFLPRLLGARRAAQFMFLSETYDANQALELGLINKVVALEKLEASTTEMAQKVASGPTKAYGNFKRLTDRAFEADLKDQLEAERIAFRAATKTGDFREGVTAFLSKRPPDFSGE